MKLNTKIQERTSQSKSTSIIGSQIISFHEFLNSWNSWKWNKLNIYSTSRNKKYSN